MTAHLPGLVQDTPIKNGGVNLLLWAHSPPFLVILCGHDKCFHKKASEIKHINSIVDILVYDELKNVVQNLLLLRKL
jgi:hypothetical protein